MYTVQPNTNVEYVGGLRFLMWLSIFSTIDIAGYKNELAIEWSHFHYVNAIIFPVDPYAASPEININRLHIT